MKAILDSQRRQARAAARHQQRAVLRKIIMQANIIAMHPSEASARRALAQISRPPDGWLEIETVWGTERQRPEYWIVAYPTEGSLAFKEWVSTNTPSKHES